MLKRLVVGGLGLGVAAWAGIAGVDSTTRDDAGQITVQGELGVFVTQLGDCVNDVPDGTAVEVSTLTGVPCDQPHHWQLIHKGEITLEEYSRSAVKTEARLLCNSAIEELITSFVSANDEEIYEYENAGAFTISPTSESWVEGDRTVDCLIGSDEETYTESFLG